MSEVRYGCATHPGLVRSGNEDSCFSDAELGLFIVADGMGGHAAGAVASGIAVREMARAMRSGESLSEAIELAHREIEAAASRGEGAVGMGSTVVALRLIERRYEIAWVGDSRAYLWNGELRQLTKDHSYVQYLLDAGLIGPEEAADYPGRNVITQGLGVGGAEGDDVSVDSLTGELGFGESLLLCSDGLSGEVSDSEMASVLAGAGDPQSKVERLLQAALASGGRDNITAILVSQSLASG